MDNEQAINIELWCRNVVDAIYTDFSLLDSAGGMNLPTGEQVYAEESTTREDGFGDMGMGFVTVGAGTGMGGIGDVFGNGTSEWAEEAWPWVVYPPEVGND